MAVLKQTERWVLGVEQFEHGIRCGLRITFLHRLHAFEYLSLQISVEVEPCGRLAGGRPPKLSGIMHIFVTGATGFIGLVLVPGLIQAGHQVLGLTRSEAGAAKLSAAGAKC